MADAQAAYRAAKEAGAEKDPQALFHLKLAEEQFAKAKTLLDQDENRRADFLLIRSTADAELALAIAQEQENRKHAEEIQSSVPQQSAPVAGGVQP